MEILTKSLVRVGEFMHMNMKSTREHTCVCACVGGCHSKAPSFHLVPVNVTKDPWENHALGLRSQSPTQLVFCALTEPPSSLNALAFIWPQHYLH